MSQVGVRGCGGDHRKGGHSLGCHHPGQLRLFPKTFGAWSEPKSPGLQPCTFKCLPQCPFGCPLALSPELGAFMSFLILFLFTPPPPALLAPGLLCPVRCVTVCTSVSCMGRPSPGQSPASVFTVFPVSGGSGSRRHSANTRPDELNSGMAGKITKEE